MALPHSWLWLPLLLYRHRLLLFALSRTLLLFNRQNLLTVLVDFFLFLTVDNLTRLGKIWGNLSVADRERVQLAKLLLVLSVLVVVEIAKWISYLSRWAGEIVQSCRVENVVYYWLLESPSWWSRILQVMVLVARVAISLLYFLHFLLHPTQFKVHPLDLAVVVFP